MLEEMIAELVPAISRARAPAIVSAASEHAQSAATAIACPCMAIINLLLAAHHSIKGIEVCAQLSFVQNVPEY